MRWKHSFMQPDNGQGEGGHWSTCKQGWRQRCKRNHLAFQRSTNTRAAMKDVCALAANIYRVASRPDVPAQARSVMKRVGSAP